MHNFIIRLLLVYTGCLMVARVVALICQPHGLLSVRQDDILWLLDFNVVGTSGP